MDDIYKNMEEYNPNKKRKILIVFHDLIADMLSNRKLNSIVIKPFTRPRKLNISLLYRTVLFCCTKNIRENSAQYFIMKISNKESFNKSHLTFHPILNLEAI